MAYRVRDAADFWAKLAEAGSSLVVVDFFATWCGPCKMIAPKIEEMTKQYPDVVFLKVDVDEIEELATEYQITAMPTFIFIKNKQKCESFCGANEKKLIDMIQQLK